MTPRYTPITTPLPELYQTSKLGMNTLALTEDFKRYFGIYLGQDKGCASGHYLYAAMAHTLRDRLFERMKNTKHTYAESRCKQAYYLSMEFLMGRATGNAALNLGIEEPLKKALVNLGLEYEELAEFEHDAGLGNGGLGRLAACFIDSCATLQLPVTGYGLRYEYGMFQQKIVNGNQQEMPDHWLRDGNPWELERPEYTQRVKFGGHTELHRNSSGQMEIQWIDTNDVLAVPYDLPIPGYQNGTVNRLRLWKAAATDEFNLEDFNAGSYTEAVAAKNEAENISMVLYPNDASENGKELRLRQQYFLASASLQDILDYWVNTHDGNFENFADKNVFQLNDTHPTVAVAELMRLLMDEHQLGWDKAWQITTKTMAYTNHTLLPEALERWPANLFGRLLPRILEIIYEINARFLREVANHWPGDRERLSRMSIIEEGPQQQVRMAHLAIVGSFSVNGVAALHSELLKKGLFQDFYQLWPEKFNNKTNGVTQRRWMAWCNPVLSQLITETIGDKWITRLSELQNLAPLAYDKDFQKSWHDAKYENKKRLAALVEKQCGVKFNPEAMFDIQVKRIHEYKRQLLNVLHVIHLYDQVKRGQTEGMAKRCVLFGGKAAPGYLMAKQIIKLINNVADVINNDPDIGDWLKVVFFPNYQVSAMEIICPAADLSEQISTAGKEASGTGNMKFMMNGAITIGTLDGANIEIREEVGDDNFFLFGLSEEEIAEKRGNYNPQAIIENDADLKRVVGLLSGGHFNQFEPGCFDNIVHAFTSPHDPWMTVADFRSYIDAQHQAGQAYQDKERWTAMSIINSANSGKFSTDRTMEEYNQGIWKLEKIAPHPDS
ncbi:glycogen/starch/alpha-glucan phosphorylase [Methylophaga nitratireducenticrescens]|uniref:Alpha-1,4 glucan phosphorylase n=1 Tax=Methylophaga nitratireducenticrescens TaxID=754476 RepID=I1XGR7_METNJ|nr:glycogen/starch/alpha-glucan phosphorylase [Methylophaga nitratireducenticrescens]AFI83586.1 glycogen/starch/alpha-glucan family phosphorylase [Methylophaga nitratireducenticrescens]AUZ83644.1 glycogen/starch/alpha-glucan family phosphorylase [Methylophaga nitratireducenticrescens]